MIKESIDEGFTAITANAINNNNLNNLNERRSRSNSNLSNGNINTNVRDRNFNIKIDVSALSEDNLMSVIDRKNEMLDLGVE